jgi:hypothetical protein
LAGALTPKAIIWNVMQITKIHFVTSLSFSTKQRREAALVNELTCQRGVV